MNELSTGTSPILPPPGIPPGFVRFVSGRGEMFYRYHEGPPGSPTLLLLHGWTASADLQFFTVYPALADAYSYVAVDHRGHGRGIRTSEPFTLEDCADDAAALLRDLGTGPVVLVGYSMGGPIAMHTWRRHPEIVAGLVLEATALEWRETRLERLAWWTMLRVMEFLFRSRLTERLGRRMLTRLTDASPTIKPYVPWIEAETSRGNPRMIAEAGRALSGHDARDWAAEVDVPAAVLLTTDDHLVKPRKQRALATALRADVIELTGDHLSPYAHPEQFARITRQLVDRVVDRAGQPTDRAGWPDHRAADRAAG
jgi:pimeloyl-ACP methyl ester carboxylesterase